MFLSCPEIAFWEISFRNNKKVYPAWIPLEYQVVVQLLAQIASSQRKHCVQKADISNRIDNYRLCLAQKPLKE
jgi:hypothetical protein